jgi:hypothetical protein
MKELSIEAGVLVRGTIRRTLEKTVWQNPMFYYKEIKGFLSSEFLMRGPDSVIEGVEQLLSKMGGMPDESN